MKIETADIDGPMRYADHGGPDGAPLLVLVHGLGASHLSWLPLAERLSQTHRVIAPDLIGFGHSAPEGRGTTVADNRDHLSRFLRQVTDEPVTLIGNSMGGMISVMTAWTHPTLVDSVALVNPALPSQLSPGNLRNLDPQLAMFFVLYNLPFVGEAFLRLRRRRLSPAQQVQLLLDSVCVDASRIEQRVVDMLVSLATARRDYRWSDEAFLTAERSLMRQLTVGRTHYSQMLANLQQPSLLVHGERDRLIDVSTARAVAPTNPRMQLVTIPDVGHVPQLECPDDLAPIITRWHAGARDRVA